MLSRKNEFSRIGMALTATIALTISATAGSTTAHADGYTKRVHKDLVDNKELKKLRKELKKVTQLPLYLPPPPAEQDLPNPDRPPPPNIDPLGFPADATFDFAKAPRQTFLHFMQRTVKPRLDRFATEGFQLRDGNSIINALNEVDDKVREGASGAVSNPSLRRR